MKRKLIFSLLAVFLLSPWPVVYAYDEALASNTPLSIEAVAPGATPVINAYGKAIGGGTPGDLFYVDASGSGEDMPFTLYITNADELVRQYRYLNLDVGIYVYTFDAGWERAGTGDGDIYITMHNAVTSFILPGFARYKITIDGGCFYSYGAGGGDAAAPRFYLTTG